MNEKSYNAGGKFVVYVKKIKAVKQIIERWLIIIVR